MHWGWLRPTRKTVGFAGACYLIVWAGFMQAWIFTDGAAPKPALFDALAPVPVWPFAIFLLLPLAGISLAFGPQGFGLLTPDALPGSAIIASYLYVLSAAGFGVCERLASHMGTRPAAPAQPSAPNPPPP
jgi:hypothetical protein